MHGLVTALFVLLFFAGVLLYYPNAKKRSGMGITAWLSFVTKGKELGFYASEIKLLYQLARSTNMAHPAALFWARPQLDKCLREFVRQLRVKGEVETEVSQMLLQKLFTLRKRIELESQKSKAGIKSSRNIDPLQILDIVVSGSGYFRSKVLENLHSCLKIERPDSSALPIDFVWPGKNVIVNFYRKEDASYYFESTVLEEIISQAGGTLTLSQNDNIERTQCRESMRAKTRREAFLYPAGAAGGSSAVISRIKGELIDVSDTGCSFYAGGKASEGLKVIVQFSIAGKPVNFSGIVRSVEYSEKNNTSILHIQSDAMRRNIQNLIMCVVIGAIDDDEELPARDTVKPVNVIVPDHEDGGETAETAELAAPAQNINITGKGGFEWEDA